jgi:NADPH:quinone reductase-like Zn-dependent oxidoreductase
MKAAVHTRYGPPEVVRISEVETPAAKDHQVLVKVHATTVNRTDSTLRAAEPFVNRFFTGLRRPRVTVLGNEFAGEVEAVGRGVTSFQVGDRVFGFNGTGFGAHAEYLTIPEDGSLATMPANLTYEEAAASTEGSHYALSMIRKAKIQRGQDVLVNGATGAIGSAAVQLLKHLGANVTAVCDTEHGELVKGLGADRVIDYTAEDFTKDEQTFDVVLDADESRLAGALGGRYRQDGTGRAGSGAGRRAGLDSGVGPSVGGRGGTALLDLAAGPGIAGSHDRRGAALLALVPAFRRGFAEQLSAIGPQ